MYNHEFVNGQMKKMQKNIAAKINAPEQQRLLQCIVLVEPRKVLERSVVGQLLLHSLVGEEVAGRVLQEQWE